MQYDVFISCKSEDYQSAEEIYEFLEANGIHTFLASKELRKLGDSEYRKAISKALKSAYHMIVFASQAEYIDTTWVYYEWDWFINAKLKGFKPGQIVTILKDVNVDDVNSDLWKYESFVFSNYKEGLLSYVETPAYLQRKEEEEKRKEEEERARRQQEEEKRKRKEARDKLIAMAEDYRGKVANLHSVDAKKIVSVLRTMGITAHSCPVCKTEVDVEKTYCPTCGWTISPIDDIEGAAYLSLINSRQLSIAKERYEKLIEINAETNLSANLSEKNIVLQEQITILNAQIKNLEVQVSEKDKELGDIILEREELALSCNKLKNRVEDLEKDKTMLQNALEQSIQATDPQIEIEKSNLPIIETEKGQIQNEQLSTTTQYKKVDLGLSVCWAEHNVGASSPEKYGDYFAWGETEPKSNYTEETYKYYDKTKKTYIDIGKDISGTKYDVARAQWGGNWRMPRLEEIKELINKCSWQWTELKGINGYKVTGPNGNSIFLPAAGYRNRNGIYDRRTKGFFWSSLMCSNTNVDTDIYYLYFSNGEFFWGEGYLCIGLTVRPVTD